MTNEATYDDAASAGIDTRACWVSVFGIVLFSIGYVFLMRFLPPPSPEMLRDEILDQYASKMFGVQLGSVFVLTGVTFLFPVYAVISAAILRMSHRSATLAFIQLGCATMIVAFVILFALVLATIAFRPDRGAELVYALSDFTWLIFIMPTPPIFLKTLSIGWAILTDKSEQPVLPRWLGYFNVWVGAFSILGVLIVLFKSGPLAWDGVLAYWLPLAAFFIWFAVMNWQLISTRKA